ncbi:O-antigen ligase family protein [Ramlibacter sp. XY19]|uniref:O-antigen ligase family protein n=1 Tax=Ramlibacter paludis TaxID=2908000 RepID=UPI0023D98368|nr:O-antigen ligase family protein [Ramlibacter paludis]MCG2593427.1 O-antigen ligase family protein [Ramlibacter paludis]
MDKLSLPQEAWNQRASRGLMTFSLASLGFFALFATAGVYISMFLVLLACCLAPRRIVEALPWREPFVGWGLLFLAYVTLRSFIGDGSPASGGRAFNAYHELLVFPVAWAVFRVARRPHVFIIALLAGAVVASLGIWISSLQLLPKSPPFFAWLQLRLDHSIDIRRISLGFGLSICAYLLVEHARMGRIPARAGYALASYLALTVLFASEGRTGQLTLLVLACCAAYRAAPSRWRYPATVGMLVAALLVAACSTGVRTRVVETVSVLSGNPVASRNVVSTQIRIEMFQNAVGVAHDHWLLGTGWASYTEAFRKSALERRPNEPDALGSHSDNPHNEYLLQLGAGGLPALVLFLGWVAWPLWLGKRASRTEQPWTGAAACVALAFAVGAAFNSMLYDFIEAHLYVTLLAWLLVRRIDRA